MIEKFAVHSNLNVVYLDELEYNNDADTRISKQRSLFLSLLLHTKVYFRRQSFLPIRLDVVQFGCTQDVAAMLSKNIDRSNEKLIDSGFKYQKYP